MVREVKYYSLTKKNSVNWEHVKFRDNCLVVDPLGAGDLIKLPSRLPDKTSLLVRPILSRMNELGQHMTGLSRVSGTNLL